IQRLLKHSIKRSAHVDVVAETVGLLEDGTPSNQLRLDTRLPVLRDRSIGWTFTAFQKLNDVKIVKK
ncbi:hypothetical protein JB92DRAFT_2616136, partial [Gautieria morchelliformis]